jgi:hypothetical protein
MQILKKLSYKFFFSSAQLPFRFMSQPTQDKNKVIAHTLQSGQPFVRKPKDEISLLLKNKYALSVQQKP